MINSKAYPYNLIFNVLTYCGSMQNDVHENVESALEVLPKREREIVLRYFNDNCSMDKIAKEYHITKERVRQILYSAMRKLRSPNAKAKILYGLQKRQYEEKLERKELYLQIKEKELAEYEERLKKYEADLRKSNDRIIEKQTLYETKLGDLARLPNYFIDEMDLSVRANNCLKRAEIITMKDIILAARDERLIRVRNLGRRTYDEIIDKISQLTGLTKRDILGYEETSYEKSRG